MGDGVAPGGPAGTPTGARVGRRLLALVTPYRARATAAVFLLLVAAGSDVLLPKLFSLGIDELATRRRGAVLDRLGAAFLLTLVVRFLATWGELALTAWLGNRIVYDLRHRLFRHLQTLGVGYVDRQGIGATISRLQNDVAVINELFVDGVVGIGASALVLIGIVVVMLATDWQLALLTFAAAPALALLAARWSRRAGAAYRATRQAIGAVHTDLAESIAGVRIVQAFVREAPNRRRFGELNRAHCEAAVAAARFASLLPPLATLVRATATATILYAGGRLVFDARLSLGELVLFVALIDRFFGPILDLSQQYATLQAALVAGERVFAVLDAEPEVRDAPDAVPLPPIIGAVAYRGVRFGYGGTEVLRGIDLEVRPGETVALVGETGAGKSTLVHLLLRFADVSAGAITVDGHDLRGVTQASLRSQLGVVLQEPFLFAGTVRDNIRFGRPAATDAAVEQAARDLGAHGFIAELPAGYETEVGERGASLSGGQRQLLTLARALLVDPRLLILDEATSGVDPPTERVIQGALRRLRRGRTALVIAHRLSTIRGADKVVVIHHGQIVEIGTHAALLARDGPYSRLHEIRWRGEVPPTDALLTGQRA